MTTGEHGLEQVPEGGDERYLAEVSVYAQYDEEFRRHAVAAAGALGDEHLRELVGLYARFDHPSIVVDDDGTERYAQHHILQRFLEVLPGYAGRAAAAGLTAEQATGLVRAMLTYEERDRHAMADPAVLVLGRALEAQSEARGPVGPEDYELVRNLVARTARYGDRNTSALDIYRALSRMGMTTAEAASFILDDLHADLLLVNPVLGVADGLSIADVDVQTFRNVCMSLIRGENDDRHIYAIQQDIALLRECIVTVCPARDIRPAEMLNLIHEELSQGRTMNDVAQRFIGGRSLPAAAAVAGETFHPRDRIGRHFIDKPGPLELTPLPYRTERGFEDGVADLGRIALHEFMRREPVGEGLWLFDRDSPEPVWYSLGGETSVEPGRVSHRYQPYPLHELSRNPTMAHCHPAALEVMIGPGRDDSFPREARPVIERFLGATPSRQDYGMVGDMLRTPGAFDGVRSVIVHGSGVTEYTFPQDPGELEAMSRNAKEIRDRVLLGIRWDRILYKRKMGGFVRGGRRDRDDVVGELVKRLDKALPKGFGLELSGTGSE